LIGGNSTGGNFFKCRKSGDGITRLRDGNSSTDERTDSRCNLRQTFIALSTWQIWIPHWTVMDLPLPAAQRYRRRRLRRLEPRAADKDPRGLKSLSIGSSSRDHGVIAVIKGFLRLIDKHCVFHISRSPSKIS
jgi:hypothetical protein